MVGKAEFIKPWAKKKSILAMAMEGSSYGSEPGQIKRLSDNNFIIPLYSYGVGVYDFGLTQKVEEKKMAIDKAEEAVEEYFKLPPEKPELMPYE